MKIPRLFISTAIICVASLFSVDLAYHPVSPYAYCNNNPVKYVDPDGRTIQVYDYANNQRVAYEWRLHEGNWGFYDSNNTLYAGDNQFIGQLSRALNGLMSGGNTVFRFISGLANHLNIVTIQGPNQRIISSSTIGNNDVVWVSCGIKSNGFVEQVPTTAGMSSDPMITLGHELGHIEYNWSRQQSSTWFNMIVADANGNPTQKSVPASEIYTTHLENQLRSENNLPLRTHYGVQNEYGYGPRIIVPSTRASRYYNSQGVTNYRPLKRGIGPYIY